MTKTSETRQQPNWDEAPELATHWCPETDDWFEGWYIVAEPLIAVFDDDARIVARTMDQEDREILLPILVSRPAPAAPAWAGAGLPPVGTVCIVQPHNTQWGFSSVAGHERTVLAYHGEFVWLGQGNMALETTRIDKVDFLPLRTPEQIAAEQREQEIARMLSLCPCPGSPIARQLCETLYDAGVRLPGKQEGEQ